MTYAAVLAAVLSVAACSGGDPAPTPSATSPVTTGTTTAPSTSPTGTPPATSTTTASPPPATPTSTGPAFPAGVPAAARQRTDAGAKAFTEHVVTQLNKAWTTPDPAVLEPLCSARFEACGAYLEGARKLKQNDRKYDGPPVTITDLLALAPEDGRTVILMNGYQEKRNIVGSDGVVTTRVPRTPTRVNFNLLWTAKGWQIYSANLVTS